MSKIRSGEGKRANMFDNLPAPDRIERAKVKMEKVIDHFLHLLALHANNAHVVYSPILSAQIPTSYAANAFNVFQQSMHQIAVVRLCALWDGVHPDKENIRTVVELIDNEDIIRMLADQVRQQRAGAISLRKASDDPAIAATDMKAIREVEIRFGDEQAAKADTELRRAIANTRTIARSQLLATVMNLRDKHVAHSLEITYREKRGPVSPMKYGDEGKLIDQSCPIIERLYCWVNGKSFSIEDSRRIDDENANALWSACKFQNIT
jgi:hypothetical protein